MQDAVIVDAVFEHRAEREMASLKIGTRRHWGPTSSRPLPSAIISIPHRSMMS